MKVAQIPGEMIPQKGTDPEELFVCPVASPGFNPETALELKARLGSLLKGIRLVWTDHTPEAIFFLSGGSERQALQKIGEKNDVLLIALPERNGFASASEVKSYLDRSGRKSDLFNLIDYQDIESLRFIIGIRSAVRSFSQSRIGIVGNESDWLVNSMPDPVNLKARFGFRLVKIPWTLLREDTNWPLSADFLDFYSKYPSEIAGEHSRIYGKLLQVVEENHLDGITVECFPLVQEDGVTACPSLALLNQLGIPAGCEGDLVSLTGMLLVKAVTGQIPWMANLTGLQNNTVLFSHCTVPLNMVDTFGFNTHYETGKGLAIQGVLPEGDYTVLRLSVDFLSAFLAEGTATTEPRTLEACRTQLVLHLDPESYSDLKNYPLGNHHLILPGKHARVLKIALSYLNIPLRIH